MSKKKYSSEQKFFYHMDREYHRAKYDIEYGSPKDCYSSGFVDAFNGCNNTNATITEFGKASGRAYALGYSRGEKASREYFLRTRKQPGDLGFNYFNKKEN